MRRAVQREEGSEPEELPGGTAWSELCGLFRDGKWSEGPGCQGGHTCPGNHGQLVGLCLPGGSRGFQQGQHTLWLRSEESLYAVW